MRPVPSIFLVFALLLSACGPVQVKPGKGKGTIEEAPVERPVVVLERSDEAIQTAIGLLKNNNFRQAEVNFEEILKVRPDLAEGHFNLGIAKLKLRKFSEAIAQFEAGLKLKPNDIEALVLLAVGQRSSGKFSDAEATYQQLLIVSPGNPAIHFNLAVLYELYMFRYDLALEHYRKYQALQKAPDTKIAGWITALERMEVK